MPNTQTNEENSMKEFKATVEKAIRMTMNQVEGESVTATYYSDYERSVMLHLLELDGTSKVNDYCDFLEENLPSEYAICHNSPTTGIILVTYSEGGIPFNRKATLNLFRELFYQRLAKTQKGYPQFKTALDYAISSYHLSELAPKAFLDRLNPDEEILDQLVRLDLPGEEHHLEGCLATWEKKEPFYYTLLLSNGTTLFSDGTWVGLAEKETPFEELGRIESSLWITTFDRELPDMEDNLYRLIANHTTDKIAGRAAWALVKIYNEAN